MSISSLGISRLYWVAKWQPGLLQQLKALDPHLVGAEGVAPGDDAGAGIVVVGLLSPLGDLVIGLSGDL